MEFGMPSIGSFGKVVDFKSNTIEVRASTENEAISISLDLEDSMVCESSMGISFQMGQHSKTFENSSHQEDKVYKKFTKEYLVQLIESVEEMRLVYISYALKREREERIDRSGVEVGLLMKISSGFSFC